MGFFFTKKMKKGLIILLFIFVSHGFDTQAKGNIGYVTELQYNFHGQINGVNQLIFKTQLSTDSFGLWKGGSLNIELLSVIRTAKERIGNDWQVFSNIDESNRPIGLFMLGYAQQIGSINIFAGVRNVNNDYFITPYTSLFTNSSCGIHPTLSANYTLSNYPYSAMCLHLSYAVNNNLLIKNSLYNGIAYEDFSNVFNFSPMHDGIFNISDITYTLPSKYAGVYNLGATILQGDYTIWANVEQSIYVCGEHKIGFLAEGSFSRLAGPCSLFYGMGFVFDGWTSRTHKDQLGVFVDRAKFNNAYETAIEITWVKEIIKNLTVQPAFHLIHTNGLVTTAALFRVSYGLNLF